MNKNIRPAKPKTPAKKKPVAHIPPPILPKKVQLSPLEALELRQIEFSVVSAQAALQTLVNIRQKRAEAQKTIQNTIAGLSDTSAFDTFDRMAEKIDQLEAEAEANSELAGELNGDSLTQRFRALEAKKTPADMALAELKQKMGLLPGAAPSEPKALPQGSKPEPKSGPADHEKPESKPADASASGDPK